MARYQGPFTRTSRRRDQPLTSPSWITFLSKAPGPYFPFWRRQMPRVTWSTKSGSPGLAMNLNWPDGSLTSESWGGPFECFFHLVTFSRFTDRRYSSINKRNTSEEFIVDRVAELNQFLHFIVERPRLFDIGWLSRPDLRLLQPQFLGNQGCQSALKVQQIRTGPNSWYLLS